MRFLDIFSAQNDDLVVGYLMVTKNCEFWPNFCLWKMFKKGTPQGQFRNAFFQTQQLVPELDFHRIYFGMLPTKCSH